MTICVRSMFLCIICISELCNKWSFLSSSCWHFILFCFALVPILWFRSVSYFNSAWCPEKNLISQRCGINIVRWNFNSWPYPIHFCRNDWVCCDEQTWSSIKKGWDKWAVPWWYCYWIRDRYLLIFAVISWSVLSEWLADRVVLTSQVILSVIVYACIKINFSVLLLTHQP